MMHVILFYKYAKLSKDWKIMETYKDAMLKLCQKLNLNGRVLVGVSENEGINGTLAGPDRFDVLAYTYALLGEEYCMKHETPGVNFSLNDSRSTFIRKFWKDCMEFSRISDLPILTIDCPEDFKWSKVDTKEALFPDLQIKLVEEIIGTGGIHAKISIQETSQGYLTPEEWHEEMKRISEDPSVSKDTVLIDCRNHKEFEIGHFNHAIDPNTKTFQQFPQWVQENKSSLKNKKILMYCTGGIRCEKATAHVRRELESMTDHSNVYHLKGGIHKYLDKYGQDGYFMGKNFVFDRRLGVDAEEHKNSNSSSAKLIVGKCLYCSKDYDEIRGDGVCTVCREMVLVCDDCRISLNKEYHCADHFHLRHCYFTNLSHFSTEDLTKQLSALEKILEPISVGKRYKMKRKTLVKQMTRIRFELENPNGNTSSAFLCRSCGESKCDGSCWGVHSLKRKKALEISTSNVEKPLKSTRLSSNQRIGKLRQKEKDIAEIIELGLSKPSSSFLFRDTSIRCPPPCYRVLSSTAKGKWCGKSVLDVLSSEFYDLADESRLDEHFNKSLIHVNGIPVNSEVALQRGVNKTAAVSPDLILKNMDIISRIVCWHEPPVILKDGIKVSVHVLPKEVISSLGSEEDNDYTIYCCNKPCSIPVHPTGPYLQNSLTMMVEADRGMNPRSLLPCHRLDRCTSGISLCCTNPTLARLIQTQMDNKMVKKLYIARVEGKFPATSSELNDYISALPSFAHVIWDSEMQIVVLDAAINVLDTQKGIRQLSEEGKSSKSSFQFILYDQETNTSLILCSPHTGRQHQLRVHLQALGFPICNDILYGSKANNGTTVFKNLVIDAINDSCRSSVEPQFFDVNVTKDSAKAAKEICYCCNGHPEKAFNESQLLMGGSQIDLHAYRYMITFGKEKTSSLEFNVDLPPWALTLGNNFKPSWI